MSKKTISSDNDAPAAAPPPANGGTDWVALGAMTDAEAEAAATADPDAQPMSEERLARARRVGLAGSLRFRLKLSREEFCARYHVPIETLRGWERGTMVPDAVAMALLQLIEADPQAVARMLAETTPAAAE